ncbi:hypothetical protein [Vulcanisaeta thermophila]|uniref:hypothetical protein n=1 Tax=Vulcanisaeta thermophila TaxID=867917 RepID=UPI000852AD36|nr:hypothetical protein [Vulcanisaeta thermophila]
MSSGGVLDMVMRSYGEFRGLAARAILNYIITELEEGQGDEGANEVLKRALSLIDMERNDLDKLRSLIEGLMPK